MASSTSSSKNVNGTLLTRSCDSQSEHFYIYLTVEMESQTLEGGSVKKRAAPQLSIITLRKMISSALQDLFGAAMGGGINIDILGFWTDQFKDPYNRLLSNNTDIPSPFPVVTVKSTYSPTTAASAVVRCHSQDFNQLWNALTLFNTPVDDIETRFEVRYTSSTLLGLQANSRQLNWPTI